MVRKAVTLGLALAVTPLGSAAQAEPARQLFDEWLGTFNSGDSSAITAFARTHLDDPLAVTPRNQRTETCGFDLVRVEKDEGTAFSALLAERCFPTLSRLSFTVADDGETLRDFNLQPFAMAPERAWAATADIANRLAERDEFAGSMIVLRDGEAPWMLSRGSFSHDDPRPITVDTPMFLASAGKMFTAVAILQLVEQGKVALDAPLSRYLPDYPNREMAKVTIRQLLNHRGGTGDAGILQREDAANRAWVRTIDDLIKLNGDRAPAFTPGSQSDYSNYGFILLGAVIERVSGERYPDFIQTHVFEPAGMTEAGYPDRDHIADVPVGYSTFFESEPEAIPSTEALPWSGSAAGGGVASANDLVRFFAALQAGKLVSTETLTMATVPGDTSWYGLGFVVQEGKHPLWGHGGFSYGMSVAAQRFPKDGRTFICIATRDMACDRLIYAWFDRTFGLIE